MASTIYRKRFRDRLSSRNPKETLSEVINDLREDRLFHNRHGFSNELTPALKSKEM